MIFVLLTIAAFFTSVISAVAGMAGGIVLLSIMTFFLELQVIVPIHGVVQLVSNSTRTLKLQEHVERRIFLPMVITMPAGVFVATQIIKSIENKEALYFLIAAIIFYVLFKPKKLPPLKIPFWGFSILGFLVGVLNPLVGATGPFQAPFYLRDDLTKEQIVATKAAAQAFGHLLKIPAFLYLGFDYLGWLPLMIGMTIAAIAGTSYGVKILAGLREAQFRMIFRVALFAAACRVTYKAMVSIGMF